MLSRVSLLRSAANSQLSKKNGSTSKLKGITTSDGKGKFSIVIEARLSHANIVTNELHICSLF